MKNLKKILEKINSEINIEKTIGEIDVDFNELNFDSRKVSENDVFFAQKGTLVDGHQYIETAIKKGAKVIICETLPEKLEENICFVKVENTNKALAYFAAEFYDYPSKKVKLIGVTGTNGKTTIVTLLFDLLNKFELKSGLISTIKYIIGTKEIPATHTTPDVLTINKMLVEMHNKGCKFCFMEVSSHALVQDRVTALNFAGSIFTNLSHDHLDYHKDFADYRNAKKLLFDNLKGNAFALVNSDDKNGQFMLQNTKANKYTYGLKTFANFKTRVLEKRIDATLLEFENLEVWSQLIGDFNASNLLAVYATAILLGEVPKSQILREITTLTSVRGRFETIKLENGVLVIIDYAHTPDALENVLQTIAKIRGNKQTLITIVGAGGNRDKAKRPIMAAIAGKYSDKVILTSDNPRNEAPSEILADMKTGITEEIKNKFLVIENRKEAIRTAIFMAKENEIVLVAGKGHETYQEIKGVRHHFDDREIVLSVIND